MKKIFVKDDAESTELIKEAIAGGAIVMGLEQDDEKCSECGVMAECRPFGKDYAPICYDCGMKDQDTTRRRMNELNVQVSAQPGNA